MRTLQTITGKNRYCGPAAISTIAGVSTDLAAATVRELSERVSVKSMQNAELTAVMPAFGFKMTREANYRKSEAPTLRAWLDRRAKYEGTYVVHITGHYVVIQGRRFADSTRREPVDTHEAPHMRCRVRNAWLVTRCAKDKTLGERVAKKAKATSERASFMSRARHLAKKHGIEITSCRKEFGGDSTGYMVYPPAVVKDCERLDPFEGDHFADDQYEVWHRVQIYTRAMTAS